MDGNPRNYATFGIIRTGNKGAGALIATAPGVAKRHWRSLAVGSYTQLSFTEQAKRCHTCGAVKPHSAFSRAAHHRDGLNSSCRECRKAYCKGWYQSNQEYASDWRKKRLEVPGVRERNAERNKAWREANADTLKAKREAYRAEHREKVLAQGRAYFYRNRDAIRERWKARYAADREKYLERCRRWRDANLDAARSRDREYQRLNCDEVRARARARYHANPEKFQTEQREYRERPEVKARLRERSLAWRLNNRDKHLASVRDRQYRKRMSHAAARENIAVTNAFLAEVRRDPCSYCGGQGGTLDHVVPLARGGAHASSNFAGSCIECNRRKGVSSALTFLYRTHRNGDR